MRGIDVKIEKARLLLTAKLWTAFDYTAYGRAVPNTRESGIIPEVLTAGSTRYQDVLLSTKKDGISFFMPEPEYEPVTHKTYKAVVGWYFAVKLTALYSSITERATEYVHNDVLDIIKESQFNIKDGGIVTGFEAFSQFGLTSNDKDNMQPYYLCRFDTIVQFNYNEC